MMSKISSHFCLLAMLASIGQAAPEIQWQKILPEAESYLLKDCKSAKSIASCFDHTRCSSLDINTSLRGS